MIFVCGFVVGFPGIPIAILAVIWFSGVPLVRDLQPHEVTPASCYMLSVVQRVSTNGYSQGAFEGTFRCPTNYYGFALALVKERFLSASEDINPRISRIIFQRAVGEGESTTSSVIVPESELDNIHFGASNWFSPLESRIVLSLSAASMHRMGMYLVPGAEYTTTISMSDDMVPSDWKNAELWVEFLIHREDDLPVGYWVP